MKSKRLLSLALAVALSLSALGVYATGSGDAGVTVSAKSIVYNDVVDVETPYVQACISYTEEEVEKLWKNNKAYRQYTEAISSSENKSVNLGRWEYSGHWKEDSYKTEKLKEEDYNKDPSGNPIYFLSYWDLSSSLKTKFNDSLYNDFYGWQSITFSEYGDEDAAINAKTSDKTKVLSTSEPANVKLSYDATDGKYKCCFQTVVKTAESDEEILERMASLAAAEEEKKAADSRSGHCDRAAWRNSAGNNARNKSSGAIGTVYAKATLQKGSVSADSSKNQVYDKAQIASIKKACKVEDDEIAFVYNVKVPDEYELIDGKNMGVRLFLPSGYTTKGYIPTVFHVPVTGAKKVENIDVGSNDILFFAHDFSPYVLILSPGKVDKYENPPTGDATVVPVALLAAASLSATGTVLLRRKRELGE